MRSNPSWHHSAHHSPRACLAEPPVVLQRGWAGAWHRAHRTCQGWSGVKGKVDPGPLLTPPKAGGDVGCVLPQLLLSPTQDTVSSR